MLVVNLAVYHLELSWFANHPAFIEIAKMGLFKEAADMMKATQLDSFVESDILEEQVSQYQMRWLQKFLAVSLDDTDVLFREQPDRIFSSELFGV